MEQDTRVWVYILIRNVHFLHKNNASIAGNTCYGFRGHMYHEENFEKMTQYMVSVNICF